MKQGKIITAHQALMNLNRQQLSLPIAYNIHKMMKQTQKAWDFQVEQEQKLFEKYQPKPTKNGGLEFSAKEYEKEFNDYIKELSNMESDIEVTPISIQLAENVKISPSDIEALDGFVEFVE